MADTDTLEKIVKKRKKGFVLEGVLENVPELDGLVSTIVIRTEKGSEVLKYNGLIMPDSFGHKIEVYKKKDGYQIIDTELNRTYNPTQMKGITFVEEKKDLQESPYEIEPTFNTRPQRRHGPLDIHHIKIN